MILTVMCGRAIISDFVAPSRASRPQSAELLWVPGADLQEGKPNNKRNNANGLLKTLRSRLFVDLEDGFETDFQEFKINSDYDVVEFEDVKPFAFSTSKVTGDLVDAVVPFMGESITDGTLATILKKPGDRVNVDEPIAQIEIDKVTIDVASPKAGVLQEYVAKEGDIVEPGTKIAIISKVGACFHTVDHVAPYEKHSKEAAPPPPSPHKDETSAAKVEKPKPLAETSLPPSRTSSATEPQLPPKEMERRLRS